MRYQLRHASIRKIGKVGFGPTATSVSEKASTTELLAYMYDSDETWTQYFGGESTMSWPLDDGAKFNSPHRVWTCNVAVKVLCVTNYTKGLYKSLIEVRVRSFNKFPLLILTNLFKIPDFKLKESWGVDPHTAHHRANSFQDYVCRRAN